MNTRRGGPAERWTAPFRMAWTRIRLPPPLPRSGLKNPVPRCRRIIGRQFTKASLSPCGKLNLPSLHPDTHLPRAASKASDHRHPIRIGTSRG